MNPAHIQARDSNDGPKVFVMVASGDETHTAEPHQHARGQLFGSSRGLLTVGVDEAVWIVPASHAVWLPPHQRHSGTVHGPFQGWSAYVAEKDCDQLPTRPCTLRTSGLLKEAVLRASTWPDEPLDAARTRVADVILDEVRSLPVEPLGLPLPADARLQRIARALIKDPSDDRGLEHWADWASVSSRTLSRRFVTETGFNFTAWRQRARLMHSLAQLAAGVSVNAIALDLGYASASAFITVFRQTFGETPAAYRLHLNR